jgi:hypothetical protein
MSYDSLLIHTCDIEHFAEGAIDDYGIPAKIWTATYEDEPCRHVSGNPREIRIGQEVVIVSDQLFVGDIDITEQDRVIIDTITYQVLSVIFREDSLGAHHKECFIEVVK